VSEREQWQKHRDARLDAARAEQQRQQPVAGRHRRPRRRLPVIALAVIAAVALAVVLAVLL
jgi:hypothetical protein